MLHFQLLNLTLCFSLFKRVYFRPRKLLPVKASVCKDCVDGPVYTEHDHERERGHCDFPRDFPLESSHEPPFIQNEVIRAVATTMCAGMHYLMQMAAARQTQIRMPFWHFIFSQGGGGVYMYTRFYISVIVMANTTT